MELTSAVTEAPPGTGNRSGDADVAVPHFRGLVLETEAPELIVPKSEVVSSNCEERSEKEDLGGQEVCRLKPGELESLGEVFIKKEFLCSLFFGVDSAPMPFFFCPGDFLSGLETFSLFWWFCFSVALSFLVKMVSRSSSELLGCSFILCFLRLWLAAAKMEETRGCRNSRLQ